MRRATTVEADAWECSGRGYAMKTSPPVKRNGQATGPRRFNGQMLDVCSAATLLGCTEKTLRARVRRRTVPFREFGGRVVFLRNDIEAFIPNNEIMEFQIDTIDLLCKRCNINVLDYINSSNKKYNNIEEVSGDKAQGMIQHLNNIQQGKKSPKEGTGEYDEGWKKGGNPNE